MCGVIQTNLIWIATASWGCRVRPSHSFPNRESPSPSPYLITNGLCKILILDTQHTALQAATRATYVLPITRIPNTEYRIPNTWIPVRFSQKNATIYLWERAILRITFYDHFLGIESLALCPLITWHDHFLKHKICLDATAYFKSRTTLINLQYFSSKQNIELDREKEFCSFKYWGLLVMQVQTRLTRTRNRIIPISGCPTLYPNPNMLIYLYLQFQYGI
jgi:hypothetical protein